MEKAEDLKLALDCLREELLRCENILIDDHEYHRCHVCKRVWECDEFEEPGEYESVCMGCTDALNE